MPLALTPIRVYQGVLGTSTATLYTVPASTWLMLRNVFFCNTNASARDYTMYIVPSGSSAGDSNKIFGAISLAGLGRDGWGAWTTLEPGDTIRAKASNASSIAVNISGLTITGDFGRIRSRTFFQALCTTSLVTQYTVPTGKRAVIKHLWFSNIGSGTPTVRFDIVKSGQSPSAASQIYNALAMTANWTVSKSKLSIMLDAGDTIRISATTKNVVAVRASGAEMTI